MPPHAPHVDTLLAVSHTGMQAVPVSKRALITPVSLHGRTAAVTQSVRHSKHTALDVNTPSANLQNYAKNAHISA